MLKFSAGNAKLSKSIHIFSLPASWSCPSADKCSSKANRETGKIKDGPNTEFRCYAASQEALYPSVRKQRWYNFGLLKAAKTENNMRKLILNSIPKNASIIRVHSSGDFFNENYFTAWMNVANQRKDILFYAYTKSLNFWVKNKRKIPKNFVLTASEGGKLDNFIEKYGLRYAKVVYSTKEAKKMKLPIDKDDSHAMENGKSFALLLHGVQMAGSPASKALSALKASGNGGYSRRISLKTV